MLVNAKSILSAHIPNDICDALPVIASSLRANAVHWVRVSPLRGNSDVVVRIAGTRHFGVADGANALHAGAGYSSVGCSPRHALTSHPADVPVRNRFHPQGSRETRLCAEPRHDTICWPVACTAAPAHQNDVQHRYGAVGEPQQAFIGIFPASHIHKVRSRVQSVVSRRCARHVTTPRRIPA